MELESTASSLVKLPELEEFLSLILAKNKEINLISSNTEEISRERHIIDSAQIIDFIDKNDNLCLDIGSGSGLAGIVLAIIMKHQNANNSVIPAAIYLVNKEYQLNFRQDSMKI